MCKQGVFTKIKKNIRRWFTLGLEEEQYLQYNVLLEYNMLLAKDNMEALKGYCVISYPLLFLMMITRCLINGYLYINIIPFLFAVVGIIGIQFFLKRDITKSSVVKRSYILTASFNIVWYAIAIFYDVIVQSGKPAVLSCLAFVLLASLFNTHPKDNIIGSLLAYAVMMLVEFWYAPPGIRHTDAMNVLIAIVMGVCLNQKNTRANISKRLYTDMYKAATKNSILVLQVDLLSNTFEVLQSPDYMVSALSEKIPAKEMIKMITEQFVSEEFRKDLMEFLNFDTLPARVDENKQLSFYLVDIYQKWYQVGIVEQRRVNHKVSAVIAIVRDVDEEKRREFEYQRQLNSALEEAKLASASKTSFLRRMSHDIRTPINGIRGMLEISQHYSNDIEKQNECRRKMWEASGYLLSLVNDVLDMSKLESGSIDLESKPFDLREIISETDTLAEMQAMEHGVTFQVDEKNSSIEHNYLIGSPIHLKRILQNLASNAIKYNRENGSVTVSYCELSSDEEVAQFQFICSDTGIGMSEKFQEKAFEPFAQEGRNANTTYAGTGLGLSIVKQLVDSMGGHIELNSTVNVGSTFVVTIPLKIDYKQAVMPDELQEHIETKGKKVLLVEDNELNMEIAEFILSNEGFIIAKAVNGQDAVDKFASSKPGEYDIVFMDIMMPVMDGLEATRTIRAMQRTDAKSVPIIAMSANAFKDDIENCLNAGMNDHLMKPLEMEKITKAIQKVLRGKEKTSNGKDYLFSSRATNSSINAIDSLIMSSQ